MISPVKVRFKETDVVPGRGVVIIMSSTPPVQATCPPVERRGDILSFAETEKRPNFLELGSKDDPNIICFTVIKPEFSAASLNVPTPAWRENLFSLDTKRRIEVFSQLITDKTYD